MKKSFSKKVAAFIGAAVMVAVMIFAVAGKANAENKLKASSGVAYAMAGGGMMVKGSVSRDAAVYNRLKQDDAYPNNIVSPSTIRMEAYLVNGKAEYEFFTRKLGNESSTERKLNEQDAFRLTDVGIFLMQEPTAVAGIGVLQTYPNPIMFPNETGFAQTLHLEHIYNGDLVVKIGDTTYVPGMSVRDCRVVGTAQQTNASTNRSERHPGEGFVSFTPQFTLRGRENNSLKLVVPANSNQKVESDSANSGYKIKVVMILKGFVITGAGTPQNKNI